MHLAPTGTKMSEPSVRVILRHMPCLFDNQGKVCSCDFCRAEVLHLNRQEQESKNVARKFKDRYEAGRLLAEKLEYLKGRNDVTVLALPRGGVPVGFEVANRLKAPLDVFIVRKLGVPGHEELAMGAIAPGQPPVLDTSVVEELGIDQASIREAVARERRELHRRERAYRGEQDPVDVHDRTVLLVDDGLATGSTMRAAVVAVRPQRPGAVVVAVPVAPPSTCRELEPLVDRLECIARPEWFVAVGAWYEDFSPTADEEVRALLGRDAAARPGRATSR